MSKTLRVVTGFALAAVAGSASGAFHPLVPQSDVLRVGSFDVQATAGFSHFGSTAGVTFDVLPRIRFGLPGSFDMAVAAPYRFDMEADRSAMRSVPQVDLAYSFLDGATFTGVARAYTTLNPSSAARDVGSGSHNLGLAADLIGPSPLSPGRFRLRGAVERTDHRAAADPVAYRLANRLVVEGGLENDTVWGAIYFGALGTTGFGSGRSKDQDSLALRFGIGTALTPNSEIRVIGQEDLLARSAEPERAIFATWTYRQRAAGTDLDALRTQVQTTQSRVDDLARRLLDLESRLLRSAEATPPLPERPGVLVLNHSGIAPLEQMVVDTVRELDFTVSGSRDEPDVPRRDRTVIQYRSGHAETAIAIARALPGNQLVERREELPGQAQVVVLIGFDLE